MEHGSAAWSRLFGVVSCLGEEEESTSVSISGTLSGVGRSKHRFGQDALNVSVTQGSNVLFLVIQRVIFGSKLLH